jgi:hypothetical protein
MADATGHSNEPDLEDGWRPMATAPRDGELIIARRAPVRDGDRPRVRHEHRVEWVKRSPIGYWRSRSVPNYHYTDQDFVGWKPLTE